MLAAAPVSTAAGAITEGFYPRNSPAAFPPNTNYKASRDAATDSTADLLDTVDCTAPGGFGGDHGDNPPRTTVQIAMYSFHSRPRVTDQLEALASQGCEVQVMYTEISAAPLANLQAAGVQPLQLSDDDYPFADGTTGRVYIHNKYILISGGVRSSTGQISSNQTIVRTGSQNLTQVGLHENDEETMQIQQTATAATGTTPIFDAYQANFTRIVSVISALPPVTPPPTG
jgi:hypothetical protein